MFTGKIYSKDINGWRVSWESFDTYRFWCKQEHSSNSKTVAVVMLNPGSLSGDGANLNKDTTLRVLRDIFRGTSYNPYVVNLFNLDTPKPYLLFEKWEQRDCVGFKYSKLPLSDFSAVMYAYGDYENGVHYPLEIKKRIEEVRDFMSGVPEIIVPRNRSGTPKHPLSVQRQGLKEQFRQAIINHS